MVSGKLPGRADQPRIARSEPDHHIVGAGSTPDTILWRIAAPASDRPWNQLRSFGPLPSAKFDPHPAADLTTHPEHGVLYAALDLPTALAEVYQLTRTINTRRIDPATRAYAFKLTGRVRLLDITGFWPLRAGASHAINTGRKDSTRAWARAFTEVWPDTAGVYYTSSLTGQPCLALYRPAAPTVPDKPTQSFALTAPATRTWLERAAHQIGYRLI